MTQHSSLQLLAYCQHALLIKGNLLLELLYLLDLLSLLPFLVYLFFK
jgi:hypothetical protein